MASGQPSPDEELTETVAPPGIKEAAASNEMLFARVIPVSDAVSIAGDLY
jgi:hypothetical protein